MGLQIVIGGGDPVLASYARAILPVREKGNQLLCTLLLGNVAVNSLLSILMADMTSGLVGFFSSTIMIVIFGEIIPQATCSRHALLIGYYTLYITKFFMLILYFAAWPLSKILDTVLGEDLGTIHSKRELQTLLDLHVQHGAVDKESGNMLHGALKFREMTVLDIMTPASDAFMISVGDRLNYALMKKIFRAGFSRIPVYDKDRHDIVGLILSKDLMLVDPNDDSPVRNFMTLFGRHPIIVWSDQKLGEMLQLFLQSRAHMAIVRDVNQSGPGDPFYECKGIVTLEDIVEEILGQEIIDELDDEGENEDTALNTDRNRDRDLAMLALLNGKTEEDKLSLEEVQAVSTHLMSNVQHFEETCKIVSGGSVRETADVQVVLSQARVVVADRLSTESMLSHHKPNKADVLYDRSKPSSQCILIMTGKVVVYAGHDQFRSELGPWSLLGLDALRSVEPTFMPDFTAYILSENIRYIVLDKQTFKINPVSPVPKRRTKGKSNVPLAVRRNSKHDMGRSVSAANVLSDSANDVVISPFWNNGSSDTPPPRNNFPDDDVHGNVELSQSSRGYNSKYERILETTDNDLLCVTDDIVEVDDNLV